MRGLLVTSVIVVAALMVACGGNDLSNVRTQTPAAGVSTNPAFVSLAARPLNLPSASGGDCPVTQAQLLSPTSPFTVGDGPVYTTGLGSASVLNVKARGNWLVGNLQWPLATDFHAKALIRGGRIDGAGQMRFGLSSPMSNDPDRPAVEIDGSVAPSWSAEVFVTTPGCYALQIDSETSSTDVIVFHVAEVTQ